MAQVIREALRQCKPACLVISEGNGIQAVLGTPVQGQSISAIKRQPSVPQELKAAMGTVVARPEAANNPVSRSPIG
ncbi:MAG: hypothetical protein ACKO50_05990 [Cyanobium sp.]